MKKPASPIPADKKVKRTPAEKVQHKSEKAATRAGADLSENHTAKKVSQKKSLRSAAKQLQKELDGRMNEVVARIRKETKAKLKEVVKEATRRLDGDTERMFEQALHTIVRHYDAALPTADAAANGTAKHNRKKLNKDGTARKPRAAQTAEPAAPDAPAAEAPKKRGPKPAATAAASPAKRGSKPAASEAAAAPEPAPAKAGRKTAAAATAATAKKRGPKPGTPATGAKRGPKPRAEQAAPAAGLQPEANDVLNTADSASTGEVSE